MSEPTMVVNHWDPPVSWQMFKANVKFLHEVKLERGDLMSHGDIRSSNLQGGSLLKGCVDVDA